MAGEGGGGAESREGTVVHDDRRRQKTVERWRGETRPRGEEVRGKEWEKIGGGGGEGEERQREDETRRGERDKEAKEEE